jgi:hypothetical protein
MPEFNSLPASRYRSVQPLLADGAVGAVRKTSETIVRGSGAGEISEKAFNC